MKGKLILFVIRSVVGKNSGHLARKIQTWIGAFLIGSVAYTATIDPAIIPADPDLALPTRAEVEDGLTFGETLRILFGFVLVGASRITSWLRAKNRDKLANLLGPLIGRSLPSLFRSASTMLSAWLVTLGINGHSVEGLPDTPLATLIAAGLAFLVSGVSSYMQDGKFNPVGESAPVVKKAGGISRDALKEVFK